MSKNSLVKPIVYAEIQDWDDTTDAIIWFIQQRYPKVATIETLLLDETPERRFHSSHFDTLMSQQIRTMTHNDKPLCFDADIIDFACAEDYRNYIKKYGLKTVVGESVLEVLRSLDEGDLFEGYLITVFERLPYFKHNVLGYYLISGVDRTEFIIVAENTQPQPQIQTKTENINNTLQTNNK